MQNLVRAHQFVLKILSENEVLISIKGHNAPINLRKLTYRPKNLNIDLVNIIVHTKFGQLPSFFVSQDIERKRNSDINQGPQVCCKFAKIDA